MKQIARDWKSLTSDERKRYKDLAAQDKERYQIQRKGEEINSLNLNHFSFNK